MYTYHKPEIYDDTALNQSPVANRPTVHGAPRRLRGGYTHSNDRGKRKKRRRKKEREKVRQRDEGKKSNSSEP